MNAGDVQETSWGMQLLGLLKVFWNAGTRLVYDGGLANAANLALSLLFALFPFMILIATLVHFYGDPRIITQIVELLFDHWPQGTAKPIALQLNVVLQQAGGNFFTFSNLIVLVLATNGIESARDGLNRAYRFTETRSFFMRRLQGGAFVIAGVLGIILAAIILIATPVVWNFLVARFDWLSEFSFLVGALQYGLAILLLALTLFSFHFFLPNGHHKSGELIWGIVITIICILIGSEIFSLYLKYFANYASLYAGLSGIMVAIIYLYCISILILYGAEFNSVLKQYRFSGKEPDRAE